MFKLVSGAVWATEQEKENIKMPSKTTGEKIIVDEAYLQQEGDQFLELKTEAHVCEIAKEGAIRRVGMDGKEIRVEPTRKEKDEGMEI